MPEFFEYRAAALCSAEALASVAIADNMAPPRVYSAAGYRAGLAGMGNALSAQPQSCVSRQVPTPTLAC